MIFMQQQREDKEFLAIAVLGLVGTEPHPRKR